MLPMVGVTSLATLKLRMVEDGLLPYCATAFIAWLPMLNPLSVVLQLPLALTGCVPFELLPSKISTA
jgi:hypothetical protein